MFGSDLKTMTIGFFLQITVIFKCGLLVIGMMCFAAFRWCEVRKIAFYAQSESEIGEEILEGEESVTPAATSELPKQSNENKNV